MAPNTNPFKPRDTKGPLIRGLIVGTLFTIVFAIICYFFSPSAYVTFGVLLLGFFVPAYAIYRRGLGA